MKNLLVIGLVLLIAISCDKASQLEESFEDSYVAANDEMAVHANRKVAFQQDQTRISTERMVIRNARIEFQVQDIENSKNDIAKITGKYDAYVKSGNSENSNYRLNAYQTIRVKSKDLDSLINDIIGIASFVVTQSVDSRDVTEEYIDIESRLKNKKAVEKRYIELLSSAKKVEEIIHVEEKIRAIREEIDSSEGRLKYLRNQASYSTLNLYFYQLIERTSVPGQTYQSRIEDAFGGGWNAIKVIVLALIYLWPLYLLGLLGFFGFKFYKSKKKQISV